MSFVVEEIPFTSNIVSKRSSPVVGIGKGFGTGPQDGVLGNQLERSSPDYFADVAAFGAAGVENGASFY
ncbi:MAG: hypothetical protein ACD_40C00261G0001 [uncultured bacterium]|nr:MAG: hypothetical protein ACD_40C00261G0001 [uncultured bacterium]